MTERKPLRTLALTPNQREAYAKGQLEWARRHIDAARKVNVEEGYGHAAASLLYDAFEALILAAIAHSRDALLHHTVPNIHNRRREQFEQLYAGRLPAEHASLRVIIRHRNAVRYMNPEGPYQPWEVAEFARSLMDRRIAQMTRYLRHVEQLLAQPYVGPGGHTAIAAVASTPATQQATRPLGPPVRSASDPPKEFLRTWAA